MTTPAEQIFSQINVLQSAINKIADAIDEMTGSIDPDDATWADASRLSWLVDAVKRSGILGE